MSSKYKDFRPDWYCEESPEKSYRSIFKWGDPKAYKVPKENMYKLIKEVFGLTDDNFSQPKELGLEKIEQQIPSKLDKKHVEALAKIVGQENYSIETYKRAKVAYGQTMLDLMRMRKGILENLPDIVLYPCCKEEIEQIVQYANEYAIPVYVYAGGSSVTRGAECIKNGISISISERFNKIIEVNEINHTVTVQSGMFGPELEKQLNNAVELFKTKHNYTCGHFPQSFEYSCVGGWVVTRGAGQNSTYYGKIEDLVLSQEYATPIGNVKTHSAPRMAAGPDLDQIMMGSEGTFGVLTNVTLKIFEYMPQNRVKFSCMFKDWQTAMTAMREVMQGQFGYPSVFRMSDPEETEVMMRMYGLSGTPLETLLNIRGFKKNEKCLMLGFTDGEKGFAKSVAKKIKKIFHKYGGMSLTGYVTTNWEHGRFSDPYLRDNLQDFGIVIDTLECSVNWDNMDHVHKHVRSYVKSRPNTICTTHMSHIYPQGANLYFIFITPIEDLEEFKLFHRGILDAIEESGAAISHHHGVGKLFAPWLESMMGTKEYNVFKVLKDYFDPKGIMNPGGTLGLDLEQSEKRGTKKDKN